MVSSNKTNYALVIAGILLIIIAASFVFVTTAEWEFQFGPGTDDPYEPPAGGDLVGGSTTTTTMITTTTQYTYTSTPTRTFIPRASVRIIGDDGSVLKEYRLFSMVGFGGRVVAYIEVPFFIDLGDYGTSTGNGTTTYIVPEQDVEVYLYIKIHRYGVGKAIQQASLVNIINAITGKDTETELLQYKIIDDSTVMLIMKQKKHVVGQWGGSFYVVPHAIMTELSKYMLAPYGEWEFIFAMKVILPSESLGMESSWITVTLSLEEGSPTTTTNPAIPSPPQPPEPKPPIMPLIVTWKP